MTRRTEENTILPSACDDASTEIHTCEGSVSLSETLYPIQ